MVKSNVVKVYDPIQKIEIKYYLDPKLKKNFDEKLIPSLQEKDKDAVIVIDGQEGSGKSTLALQLGKYVDPTLNLDRVVFTAEEFRNAIYKAKKGQCIVYDEAFTGLSSRSSLSAVNRVLVSLMMQMRQKNLFVLVVLPTFFLLDKYVALFRTKALIHVYENKGIRGYFRVYNRKKKKYLYLAGKQTYSYGSKKAGQFIYTKFKGRFHSRFALGDEKVEAEYRKRKEKALKETEKNPMTAGQVKYREQRDIIMYLFRKITKMKYKEMSNLFGDYDLEMSDVQISRICAKFGEKSYDEVMKSIKSDENDDKDDNSTAPTPKTTKND